MTLVDAQANLRPAKFFCKLGCVWFHGRHPRNGLRTMTENEKQAAVWRTLLNLLSSTRMPIILLSLLAIATLTATILPYEPAQTYIYGTTWFRALLALLGVSLAVCMVWRKRIGLSRVWSLCTHGGVLLVLIGALFTLVFGERGMLTVREGETVDAFMEESDRPSSRPLGFSLRLLDFRIDYYPPVDYLYVGRYGEVPRRFKVEAGRDIEIPRLGKLGGCRPLPEGGEMLVEVASRDGKRRLVPVAVGKEVALEDFGATLHILRYEPSFKIDIQSKSVTSDSELPLNPALQVRLSQDAGEGAAQWLFAKTSGFNSGSHVGLQDTSSITLRFLHPRYPILTATAGTAAGTQAVHVPSSTAVHSPWDPQVMLLFERVAERPREYESEVEVLEAGKVVKKHVIRVNSPLTYRGIKISQAFYDQQGLRWSGLGVARDRGVWVVYAGFIAMTLGLVGSAYLKPIQQVVKTKARSSGEDDGQA